MSAPEPIPNTLYKYRIWNDPYHQKLITEQQVFLASPANLNDPFDASLPWRYDPAELTPENIFKKLIEVGRINNPGISEMELHDMAYKRQASGVFENGEYWKEAHSNTKENVHKTFGILSLTTKMDNLLMWAHYGNCHRGFCVGLDSKILYDAVGGTLGRVLYNDEFPVMPLFNADVSDTIKYLNTKSTHWQYEDEYRLTKVHGSNKVITIPKEAIKEVIIGCNMSANEQVELCDAVKMYTPGAQIFTTHPSLERFKLDIYPYTKVAGNCPLNLL